MSLHSDWKEAKAKAMKVIPHDPTPHEGGLGALLDKFEKAKERFDTVRGDSKASDKETKSATEALKKALLDLDKVLKPYDSYVIARHEEAKRDRRQDYMAGWEMLKRCLLRIGTARSAALKSF
jgi:hypothetical protein